MKILVVTHDSNFSGGANRSLYMVLSRLKLDYNVEVEVLLPKKNGELNRKLDEIEIPWFSYRYYGVISGQRHDGKDILRYGKVYIGYILEHLLSLLLNRKLKEKNYDLIYTNTRLPIVGAKLAKKLKIPHVCHVREFGTVKPIWGFWGYEKIYDMSSKIILISHALRRKFQEYVPSDKLVTIHNGVESALGLPKVKKSISCTFNLLLTGRLVPDKGHKDAIEAMAILKGKGYKNIKLHIAGSSPARTHISWYAEKIKKMVSDYKLDKEVIFLGEVKEMEKLRTEMDVELMCSICETFGRVTVEGMRNHLLLIGSNTGGTPEIIQDGKNGLLYEQGNAEDLASKIEMVYKDRNLMMNIQEAGYSFAQENFTPDENVAKIYKVFESVLEHGGENV